MCQTISLGVLEPIYTVLMHHATQVVGLNVYLPWTLLVVNHKSALVFANPLRKCVD